MRSVFAIHVFVLSVAFASCKGSDGNSTSSSSKAIDQTNNDANEIRNIDQVEEPPTSQTDSDLPSLPPVEISEKQTVNPPPGNTRPVSKLGTWDVPESIPHHPLPGLNLEDFSALSILQGFKVEIQIEQINRARIEYDAVHDTIFPSTGNNDPQTISFGEHHKLAEFNARIDAATYRFNTIAADSISALHVNFFEIERQRRKLRILQLQADYFSSILEDVSTLVQIGEAPNMWVDKITRFIAKNESETSAALALLSSNRSSLLHESGLSPLDPSIEIANIELIDPNDFLTPDVDELVETATTLSTEILELFSLRSAAENKVLRLQWELQQANNPDQTEMIEKSSEIALEQSSIEELNAKLFEQDNKVQKRSTDVISELSSAKDRYHLSIQSLLLSISIYNDAISQYANGEIDLFELVEYGNNVFIDHLSVANGLVDFSLALSNLDRILYEGLHILSLDPPEGL